MILNYSFKINIIKAVLNYQKYNVSVTTITITIEEIEKKR